MWTGLTSRTATVWCDRGCDARRSLLSGGGAGGSWDATVVESQANLKTSEETSDTSAERVTSAELCASVSTGASSVLECPLKNEHTNHVSILNTVSL